jgi:hypothetical protein
MQLTLLGCGTFQLRQATDQAIGVVMRAPLRFEFHPERVRISSEEILADLRYPVRASREQDGRKRARPRRGRA